MIKFSWDITYVCNYRCPYCWWDPHWGHLAEKYAVNPTSERWAACWERVGERYGAVEIEILGGEPLHFPRFLDLLASLTRKHRINITTNLSVDADYLREMVRRCDTGRLKMSASFHPHFAMFDEFFEKVLFLNANGVRTPVNVVAYPSYLEELARYRDVCRRNDVCLTVWAFSGRFNGRDYPDAYTAAERDYLKEFMPDHRFEYNLQRQPTLGKRCHSGHLYANVKADGTVYRCGMAGSLGKTMGSIFDPGFRLMDDAAPCPVEHCVCSEYVYLEEEMERRSAALADVSGGGV